MSLPPVTASLCGWTLFATLLLSIAIGFGAPVAPWIPGVLAWVVGLRLFSQLGRLQRVQSRLMLTVGGLAALIGILNGADAVQLIRALYANHVLIAMLGAVTFLRLIAPTDGKPQPLPQGRAALWKTLLGVHLLGAVINMSAIFILGDRLSRRGRITALQARVLSRGFSLAAHWSPFFVAMGVALTQAPGSQAATLSMVGLVPAALGLLIAGAGLSRTRGSILLRGYPMRPSTLAIPLLLAVGVFAVRWWLPEVGVITVVSALSLLTALLVVCWRRSEAALARYQSHIIVQLPRMGGELVLFLAAGVLSVGIGLLVQGLGVSLAGIRFGSIEAVLLLWVIVALAVIGVHPLISIVASSGVLGAVDAPNLLGMTYLMTWALGVAASPLSGMHMALQGRYGVPAYRFVVWNGGYTLLMLLVNSAVLVAMSALNVG